MNKKSWCAIGSAFVLSTISGTLHAQQQKAEVMHLWTSSGESAAVKVLADQFAKAGGTWVDSGAAGHDALRTAAVSRILGGNPPAAVAFHAGTEYAEFAENGLLLNVDELAKSEHWSSVMPSAVMSSITKEGKIYGVPVDITGLGWLWYNKEVFRKIGASDPHSWSDVIATLDKAKAAGVVPLAFGDNKVYENDLFNAVLAGDGGSKMWYGVYRDHNDQLIKGPEFKAIAATFKKLRGYVDQGAPGRNWNDATSMVIRGKAAMQIMGDWAKGEFVAAGQTPGKDFGCVALQSPSGGTQFRVDVLILPKNRDESRSKTQLLLAKVVTDPTTQLLFALKKGAIPVRTDIDSSKLDVCARAELSQLSDKDRALPAEEVYLPPATSGAVSDVISQFWNSSTMTVDEFSSRIAEVLKP
jgi:glucose/mannose transport system substrate-binding protein